MADEPKEPKIMCLCGDPVTFGEGYIKFKNENTIIEKHITSMPTEMPNPAYKNPISGLIVAGQKPTIQTVIISAVIFYHEKKKKDNKDVN